MPRCPDNCIYVVDTTALYEIATTTSNEVREFFVNGLENGSVAVPTKVWLEFQSAFEDEAEMLNEHVSEKIQFDSSCRAIAGEIADGMNPSFSEGPWDNDADLHVASSARILNLQIATTVSRASHFSNMVSVSVRTLTECANDP